MRVVACRCLVELNQPPVLSRPPISGPHRRFIKRPTDGIRPTADACGPGPAVELADEGMAIRRKRTFVEHDSNDKVRLNSAVTSIDQASSNPVVQGRWASGPWTIAAGPLRA